MSIASAKRKIFERYRKGLQKAIKESECNRHFFYDAHGNTVYTSKTNCLYCKIELLEQQFQQARQDAARECLEIIIRELDEGSCYIPSLLDAIKFKFGLEV